MKKLIPFFSAALILTACNSTPDMSKVEAAAPAVQQNAVNPDTLGLARYQEYLAQHELAETPPVQQAPRQAYASATPRVQRQAPVRTVSQPKASAPAPQPAPAAAPAPVTENTGTVSTAGTDGTAGTGTGTGTGETAKAEKKGMSKATKGAIIGGVGGAVAGAVINKKNRVAGAVIGAVIGAGGGYVIGKNGDKKTATPQYITY